MNQNEIMNGMGIALFMCGLLSIGCIMVFAYISMKLEQIEKYLHINKKKKLKNARQLKNQLKERGLK